MIRSPTRVRNANSSLVWTLAGTRATRSTSRFLMLFGFFHKVKEVTPELLWVEAHPEILHAQRTVPINERGEESVVDSVADRFGSVNTVSLLDLRDAFGRTSKKAPARKISGESLRIFP